MRRVPRPFAAALAVPLVAAALALAGCAGADPEPDRSASASGGTFPVTVGSLRLEQQPKKIVSLSPTATEMLYAIGAGPQVVAVDDQSNHPAQVPKSDLSGLKPNAEAIAGKNPDLVVLANDTNKIVEQLATLKVPTFLVPAAKTIDDSYGQLNDLGKLTGHPAEAAGTVSTMRAEIAKLTRDVRPRARKLKYFHELDPTLYSVTSKTFLGSVYSLFGLENVADAADAAGSGYPKMSAEAVVKANPDLIFLADSKCCQQSVATVRTRPGFADVRAVRNDGVVALDDDIASRWGPRIVDLVRIVAGVVAKVPAE